MSNRFYVPDESPPPSTPDRNSHNSSYIDGPSTTPAGLPASSTASFTPAGAPSASYLGSSMMRGVTGQKSLGFGTPAAGGSSRNLFGTGSGSGGGFGRSDDPLGRSIHGGPVAKQRSKSGLSNVVSSNNIRPTTYEFPSEDEDDDEEDDDDDQDAEGEEDDYHREQDAEGDDDYEDPFLNLGRGSTYDKDRSGPDGPDESDLMVLTTPAATQRVRKEAEHIFRASTAKRSLRATEFRFASIAKDLYTQAGYALLSETPELIESTEELVSQMYDEGIGAEDDAEKLDTELSHVALSLVHLWDGFASQLPPPEGEHEADIGPPINSEPFQKAAFVAHLVLQIHHSRFKKHDIGGDGSVPPLPETLFEWLRQGHNPFPNQLSDVSKYRPSPACHSLFWQTIGSSLIRGELAGTAALLRKAGWDKVRIGPRGDFKYVGQALENVIRAVNATCDMLESCPGVGGNWDIWSSDWTLFHVQARSSFDKLSRFAEGRDRDELGGSSSRPDVKGGRSLAGLAREAGSQVPWEIYQYLQNIFDIVLGSQDAIIETAQDWCEATVGLFAWWDAGRERQPNKSLRLSRSQSMRVSTNFGGPDAYADRLARAIHTVVDSDFHFNSMNAVEVAIASAFEGNYAAVIGILRTWSLPVASAVAELASLGQWLPRPEKSAAVAGGLMDALDADDLEILGMGVQQSPDDIDGIKDTTLQAYARELAGVQELSPGGRDGWEIAVQVLGRMDSVKRSEEMVGELLKDLLETIDVESNGTVERMWRILNDLGMMRYAEDVAEAFAEILVRDSHRYGEALWYYALAHRTNKVREVCNTLMSLSLVRSAAYPAAGDMDAHLKRLYGERKQTVGAYAGQDPEAARILDSCFAAYGCLRNFYDERDRLSGSEGDDESAAARPARRRRCAEDLVVLIASAASAVRGGEVDASVRTAVPQELLLALLGEATVFVGSPSSQTRRGGQEQATTMTTATALTLEQMNSLLQAVEGAETLAEVSAKAYAAAESFFGVVLASGPGLRSQPSDLMRSMTTAGGSSAGGSFVLAGSSLLAAKVHDEMARGGGGAVSSRDRERGWDWRGRFAANASADEVCRRLRIGLCGDLARVWLEEADNVARY